MEVNDRRIQKLERILRELMDIHSQPLGPRASHVHMWLDLAIQETRTQIEKMRIETIH